MNAVGNWKSATHALIDYALYYFICNLTTHYNTHFSQLLIKPFLGKKPRRNRARGKQVPIDEFYSCSVCVVKKFQSFHPIKV